MCFVFKKYFEWGETFYALLWSKNCMLRGLSASRGVVGRLVVGVNKCFITTGKSWHAEILAKQWIRWFGDLLVWFDWPVSNIPEFAYTGCTVNHKVMIVLLLGSYRSFRHNLLTLDITVISAQVHPWGPDTCPCGIDSKLLPLQDAKKVWRLDDGSSFTQ